MHSADQNKLIAGRIIFRASGKAIVLPHESGEGVPEEIHIRSQDTSTALPGDSVQIKLLTSQGGRRGKSDLFGKVVNVVERARSSVVGRLIYKAGNYYVAPDDPRVPVNVVVADPKDSGLTPVPNLEDKVSVRLDDWEDPDFFPTGTLTESFGKNHTPMAEFAAILHKYGLDEEFPADVEKELASIPEEVTEDHFGNRMDCRDLFTFTIDPDDAKDFDDAISIEKLENGQYSIGVHIADVSAYVESKSALDKEAKRRGNSTYLVGTVIPMLPHKLSSGVCSLKEGVNRLTKSVFVCFDQEGHITKTSFANTVICSNKRLSYRQAMSFLKEDELQKIIDTPMPAAHQTGFPGRALSDLTKGELVDLQTSIRQLWFFAQKMRSERMAAGSLDLDMPEVKIYLSPEGWADRIVQQESDESHQLIEEFMLLANEKVAQAFKKQNLPAIHRVHDKPDPEKLEELGQTVRAYGVQVGDLTLSEEVSKFLRIVRTHPQGYSMKVDFLRSLRQAKYSDDPIGHYGLHKSDYLHFTSPIRRYSDLIVHRIFESLLKKTKQASALSDKKVRPYKKEELNGLGEHLSITEQNSVEAERDSVKVKLLEFYDRETIIEPRNRTVFTAIITDVKGHGLFVEMADTLAYGFIPYKAFKDDHYEVSRDGKSIIGKRRQKEYCIGQRLPVIVATVDRFKRQIDLALPKGAPDEITSSQDRKEGRGRKAPAKKTRSNRPAPPASKTGRRKKSSNPKGRGRKRR